MGKQWFVHETVLFCALPAVQQERDFQNLKGQHELLRYDWMNHCPGMVRERGRG